MATIGTISPTLTLAGKKAMAASGSGVALKIDGVTFGKGLYKPTGNETAMKSQVGSKVTVRAGARPNPYQLRIISVWNEDVGQVPITEIIWWQGTVPVFVWAVDNVNNALTVKTDGAPFVLFSDLGFADQAPNSISFVIDPTESVALAALLSHEVESTDPHTQYLPWSRFPDAMSYVWAKNVAGSANAIALTMGTGIDVQEYLVGQTFRFMAAYGNTGAVSVNVNGLGAKAFVKNAGEALTPGDIVKGAVYDAIYDGTRFKLASQAGAIMLNNTLTSTSATEALTAAMGKKLNDEKLALDAASVALRLGGATYLTVTSALMNLGADIAAVRIKGYDVWHAGNQLALGTTGATGRAALSLGTLSTQNADNVNIQGGLVKGMLSHTSGYFVMAPFSEAYDDGSLLRMYWNGVSESLEFRNTDGGYVTLSANYFQGDGSKLRNLNGSYITAGLIAAERLNLLNIGTTPATARAALMLGAAAMLGVQLSTADDTAGVLMLNGAHGLGAAAPRAITLADTTTPIGHYRVLQTDPDNPFGTNCTVEIERYAAAGGIKQTVTNVYSAANNRQAYRTWNGVAWTGWIDLFTSLNSLALGTTPSSARAALELGSMATQNADAVNVSGGVVTATLNHKSGYMTFAPFDTARDDGSVMRAYFDGNTGRLIFFKSAGGTGPTAAIIAASGFAGDGSLLTGLNGSQIVSGIIAAARLGILNIGTTPATARQALELGLAALADLTTSNTDSTAGRVTRVGDFGLGGASSPLISDVEQVDLRTGFYETGGAYANPPAPDLTSYGDGILNIARSGGAFYRMFFSRTAHRLFYIRQGATGGTLTRSELWHSLNQLALGTTPATGRAALALGNMATQNAEAVNISGGYVKAQLTHTAGYLNVSAYSPDYDDGNNGLIFWNGLTSSFNFRKAGGANTPVTLVAGYFQGDASKLTNLQGDGSKLTNLQNLNGSAVNSGVIAPAYLGLLNIGTTPSTARAALALGSMATQNSDAVNVSGGQLKGQLTHSGNYFTMLPFGQAMDDGSTLRMYWNGTAATLSYRNTGGGYVTLEANYFQGDASKLTNLQGDGSKLTNLNGSQVATGTIAAERLGLLNIGTTPATARVALALGSMATQNADNVSISGGSVKAQLYHSAGYMTLAPFSAAMDDGSTMRAYWNGNAATLVLANTAAGGTVTLTAGAFWGDGSKLSNLNGSQVNTGTIAAERLGLLNIGTTAATARTALGLGTAAQADVTTSPTDATAGRMTRVGDFGLGGASSPVILDVEQQDLRTGFYETGNNYANPPTQELTSYGDGILNIARSGGAFFRLMFARTAHRLFMIRQGATGGAITRSELWHTLNQLALGTTSATARDALALGSMATQNASAVNVTGGQVKAALAHSSGYMNIGAYGSAYDDGTTGQLFWSGTTSTISLRKSTGATPVTLAAGYFQGDGSQLTNLQNLNGSAVNSGVIAPAYIGMLNIGTTPSTARTALALGNMATQNSDAVSVTGGAVKAQLSHASGYLTMSPFSAAMDDGSTMRAYWNGTASSLALRNTASGGTVTVECSYFQGDGSKLTGLNGSQVISGTIAAARLGLLNIGTTAATARTALELGTLASQNYGAVTITGGTITGTYALNTTGNAATATAATRLATPRNINGVAFDGTANITVTITPAQAGVAISGQSAQGLGTYSFLRNKTGSIINISEEVPGSNMAYSGSNTPSATVPQGTWRCMSYAYPNESGLFLRIA